MSAPVQFRLSDLEEAELDACVVMLVGLMGRGVSRPEAFKVMAKAWSKGVSVVDMIESQKRPEEDGR